MQIFRCQLNINIFDKTCKKEDKNCDKSDLEDPDNTYDFKTIVWWICEAWIKNPEGYIWRFYNLETWEEIKKYWDYIDDYKFLSDWTWKIYLRVIDNCGNTWEVYNNIIIKDENTWLKASIEAFPITWLWPLKVDFEWFANWLDGKYNYEWDFWDWNSWYWKEVSHIFKTTWVYNVRLTITDSNWNSTDASVLIKVTKLVCDKDSDWDNINDCIDKCPLVVWEDKNDWCPVFKEIKKPDFNWCSYKDKSAMTFWNAICNSCPCSNFLDFNADLRECDLVFPAITSPDSKEIYSRWNFWKIK